MTSILKYPRTFSIIIAITLVILVYLIAKKNLDKEIEFLLSKTTDEVKISWDTVTITHLNSVEAILNSVILTPKIKSLLYEALNATPEELKIIRAKIFAELYQTYKKLNDLVYLRQLHFHSPENISLLRFHAPNLYGDDLTKFRPLVANTNKLKKPHYGFEIGRIFTGYRYVFPIFYNDTHIGSVELSKSFESLRKSLSELHTTTEFILIINKEILLPKLIEQYKKFYHELEYLKGWYIEDPVKELKDSPPNISQTTEEVLRYATKNKKFVNKLLTQHNFSEYFDYKNSYYIITAIKILESNTNTVQAVLLTVTKNYYLEILFKNFYKTLLLLISLVICLSFLAYLFIQKINRIRLQQLQLELITENMGSGLLLLDKHGNINYINSTGAELLGYKKEELIGLLAHNNIHYHQNPTHECPIIKAINKKTSYEGDEIFRKSNGELINVHVTLKPLLIDSDFICGILVFTDITQRKKMEEKLFIESVTDSLTGLYNRRYLIDKLMHTKKISDRYGHQFAVLMLDIDKFKSINDNYGHDVGDQVIKKLADIIKTNTRESDVCCRWGGEEFLVLLFNTNCDDAIFVAERIRQVAEHHTEDGLPNFTVSIGVACYYSPEDITELIQRADKALYKAKASGRNCVMFVENT